MVPATERPDLLAQSVTLALAAHPVPDVHVAEIDPALADTAQFCAAYDVPPEVSANCVVVAGRRGGEERIAACMVLATTRADVNGVVRRRLDVRKASFMSMDAAVEVTGMEYGGITPSACRPIGRSSSTRRWPISRSDHRRGVRRSKLALPGSALAALPGAAVVDDLARPA